MVEKLVGEKRVEVVIEVVVGENGKVVLYSRNVNGNWEWNKSGNEKKGTKYVGEIENRYQMDKEPSIQLMGISELKEVVSDIELSGKSGGAGLDVLLPKLEEVLRIVFKEMKEEYP